MMCTALCSMEEAKQMLIVRGYNFDIKTIRNIMKRFAVRAREGQKIYKMALTMKVKGKGKRYVVSTDGGRIRIRTIKRGPTTKNNRNRYKTNWREPKLLIIYCIDEKGRIDKKEFLPIIDGAIVDGCSEYVFDLIQNYLLNIQFSPDDKLLFVADGAIWIWERVKKMKEILGLKDEQFFELLDFYHAIEHLNSIAKLKDKWTSKYRKRWVTKLRSYLNDGKIKEFIESIKTACECSKNKLLERECQYFIKNECRLEYAKLARLKFPIGSGAMESTIRRVINLRLKSPGIFWTQDTANEMILIRSYYKANRWNQLKEMAYLGGLKEAA